MTELERVILEIVYQHSYCNKNADIDHIYKILEKNIALYTIQNTLSKLYQKGLINYQQKYPKRTYHCLWLGIKNVKSTEQ